MRRPPLSAVAGIVFVLLYVVAATTLPDHLPAMHWALEAAYWLVAGVAWVIPIRWLMLWSVGKR